MAQIEAYIYIFDFQVLKMWLYINNSSKNGPEVTENLEILAILPQNGQKLGYFFNFEGQYGGKKYVRFSWEWL